jgi:hypothetical protein
MDFEVMFRRAAWFRLGRNRAQLYVESGHGFELFLTLSTYFIFVVTFPVPRHNTSTMPEQFMDRRTFLKSATATGLAVGVFTPQAHTSIPEHNWDKYDWGSGPPVLDRLYQGPFPQYGPCAIVSGSDVSMITSPSREIVSNYGMGLIVYLSDDTGPLKVPGQTQEKTLEDLVKLPFVQKIYLRPNWREVQKQPGRLNFSLVVDDCVRPGSPL